MLEGRGEEVVMKRPVLVRFALAALIVWRVKRTTFQTVRLPHRTKKRSATRWSRFWWPPRCRCCCWGRWCGCSATWARASPIRGRCWSGRPAAACPGPVPAGPGRRDGDDESAPKARKQRRLFRVHRRAATTRTTDDRLLPSNSDQYDLNTSRPTPRLAISTTS